MPTFRITGPDGQTYNVTPPEGTNPTEDEILAQVQAQAGGGEPSTSAGSGVALRPAAPSDPRSTVTRYYQDYFAKPLTNILTELAVGSREAPLPGGYRSAEAEKLGRGVMETAIPQTPTAALVQGGTAALGPLGWPARIGGSAALAGLGGVLEQKTPGEIGRDMAWTGGTSAAAEIASPLVARIIQGLPGVKGAFSEKASQSLLDTLEGASPEAGAAVRGVAVEPTMKGGTTMAQLRQAATGGQLQTATSEGMKQTVAEVNRLAGNPTYPLTGAVKEAWDMMAPLDKAKVIGAPTAAPSLLPGSYGQPGPSTLSLEQLQKVRAYIGSEAFKNSPAGQGVTPVAMQKTWAGLSDAIDSRLTPEAKAAWDAGNQRYGAVQSVMDWLQTPNATSKLPNRILMNRNSLSDYLDQNREELIARGGKDFYDKLVQGALTGAQPGTRDILTSGAGTPMEGVTRVFGRATGGSPAIPASLLQMFLPNIGSQYTGRGAASISPVLQTIIDMAAQGAMQKARSGQPVQLGPLPY